MAFAEIEQFPCSVLAHHYPDIPNLGDVSKHEQWPDMQPDVLVGGSPCQAFSVAGLRKGLDDPRGNLTLTYLAVVDQYRPKWVVWENVPGVLSIDGGRTFGTFLGGLGQLGYGFAYRVLDAQYFGVPQRRRRVFVVGHLGDWRRAAAVLFERQSLSGNPAPSREAREIAPTIPSRSTADGGLGTDFDCDGGLIQDASHGHGHLIARCVTTGEGKRQDYETTTLIAFQNHQDPDVSGSVTHPIGAKDNGMAIAFDTAQITSKANRSTCKPGVCHTLHSGNTHHVVTSAVRRLTPRECERLQGFPDDYTLIPHCNKPAADGPRYKALGNSMAVPVIRWIGERINAVCHIGDFI